MRLGCIVVLSLLFVTSQDVVGQSLRCYGNLVSIGDFRAEVADHCGEPDSVESYTLNPDGWTSNLYDYEDERYKAPYLLKGPINEEIWIYRFNSNRLPYYLYFRNGRLFRLEAGRR